MRTLTEQQGVSAITFDGIEKLPKQIIPPIESRLEDIDHLCCLAHARAKFKYALEQSGDKDSEYLLDCIGWKPNMKKAD